jgi:Rho GTPase-activating protein 1
MDAYNLSLVFSPNLVSSGNPVRDAQMCSIPSGLPSVSVPTSLTPTKGKTSLGSVIKLCIERYFEIFEEVPDRSEAVPTHGDADTSLSHSLDSLRAANDGPEEDDDMDASMLVMPLGPNSTSPPPPSAWTSPRFFNSPPVKSQVKRHKRTGSGGSVESAPNSPTPGPSRFNSTHNGSVGPAGTAKGGASRSLVSIEKAVNGSGGRGSITVGRGTTKRKGSGAGVEAVGVTALGFFTAPITDKKTGEEEPSKSRELSEVAE